MGLLLHFLGLLLDAWLDDCLLLTGTTTTANHNAALEGNDAGGEPTHLCPGEDAAPLRNLGGE